MSALAVHPPMPTRLPSLRPRTEPAGPDTCPLHGPDSPYTRNTLGYYGSYAPSCCGPAHGCLIGLHEAIETALGDQIMEDVAILSDYPADDTVRTRLRQNYNRLRRMTTVLVTPLSEARRILWPPQPPQIQATG